jgi:hypothetical protein
VWPVQHSGFIKNGVHPKSINTKLGLMSSLHRIFGDIRMFFLSFNHIGDFTISVSHFNAYLVLEFLSHEGILHFQDIVDEHEHCGWANPIDLTIKASTSSPFEAHGQSLGWEYSQVFAVFMWCFLFVFHCFPLISIVFH